MPDWTKSMEQSFEYYTVDPGTWKDVKPLKNVKSCTINRDCETDTLGSATIDMTESIDECYVRVYLVTIQNGIKERHPLGTFLIQAPSYSYDGRIMTYTMDAYTPLIELKENQPPLGYSLLEGDNIMEKAYLITRENVRAPVVKTESDKKLYSDFVANTDDKWINFAKDLIYNAEYEYDLDELGRILFAPIQDIESLQPVKTFDDSNSSILYPDITIKDDMFGTYNVVEVTYIKGKDTYFARVVNDDPNSPTSTVRRGREIKYREVNPKLTNASNDNPSEYQVQQYAERLLKELSTIQKTVSYTHAYCPVRLRDCVRLNYPASGLNNVKGKVISQSIKCENGCSVSEKAVYTAKLWR